MDIADRADDAIEAVVRNGVAAVQREIEAAKTFHTNCVWCGEPTADGAPYCSFDCKKDDMNYRLTVKRTLGERFG